MFDLYPSSKKGCNFFIRQKEEKKRIKTRYTLSWDSNKDKEFWGHHHSLKNQVYQIFLFFLVSKQRRVHIAKMKIKRERACEKPFLGDGESFQIKACYNLL